MKSTLCIPNDGGDVYVAGQTAPGNGITLIKHDFGALGAKDVIIRNIRVRVGDSNGVSTGGMGLSSCNDSIIDHCSISWATDEGFSSRVARNLTFQWNIIGESLHDSVHYATDANGNRIGTNPHAFAASISGDVGSFHHNLLINNTGRNWSLAGSFEPDGKTLAGKVDIRNNVVYNWQNRTTDGGIGRVQFVNNYYKAGAESRTLHSILIDGKEPGTQDTEMIYVPNGNKMVALNGSVILNSTDDPWAKGSNGGVGVSNNAPVSKIKSTTQFWEPYVNTESADNAYKSVLAKAGAGIGVASQGWDYIDTRYIKEATNGTYTYTGSKQKLKGIIDSQNDVGGYPNSSNFKGGTAPVDTDKDGMPDDWEIKHGLNPNDSKDGNLTTLSADDYTNVEMYLNELAGDTVVFNGTGEEIPDIPIGGELIKDVKLLYTPTLQGNNPAAAQKAAWLVCDKVEIGDIIHGDRTNTFLTVPSLLKDAEYLRTSADGKNYNRDLAEFIAGEDITVYVGVDSRITTLGNWLSTWTKTSAEMQASNNVTYVLYAKDFKIGDKVVLGTNNQQSGCLSYFAAAVVKTETSRNTDIDINNDGKTDDKDLALLSEYILRKVNTLPNPKAADLDGNGIITSTDLALLKRELIKIE